MQTGVKRKFCLTLSLKYQRLKSKTIQYNSCKNIVKSTRRLKIHQRGSKTNLLDDKNKLLDEVAESNNIVTRTTKKKTNEISKAQSEEYVNTINEVCKHMVFWK